MLLTPGVDGDLHVLTDHLPTSTHRRAGRQSPDVTTGIAAGDDGEELVGGPQRGGHDTGYGIGIGLSTVEGNGAQACSGAPGAAGQLGQLSLLDVPRQSDGGRQDPGLVIGVAPEELNALGSVSLRLRPCLHPGLSCLTGTAACAPHRSDRRTDGGDGGASRQEPSGIVGSLGAGGIAGQHDDLGGAQVRGGAGDTLPIRIEDDGSTGTGELLDEPRGAGAGDDTDPCLSRSRNQTRPLR